MTNELTKLKKRKKRRAYPPKYRAEKAKLVRKTTPWKQSTGPRSTAGKATAAQNALKHGLRGAEVKALKTLLRHQAAQIKALLSRQRMKSGFKLQEEPTPKD